jgi:hypothetical protein
MNHVLGIVQYDRIEPDTVLFFETKHTPVDPIETIGLRGWAGLRAFRYMDVMENLGELAGCRERGFIVWIHAEKEIEILVTNDRQIVPHHVSNDLGLLPARDKDRNASRSSGKSGSGDSRFGMPQAVGEANQDRNEIVDSADQQRNRQRSEQPGPKRRKNEGRHGYSNG